MKKLNTRSFKLVAVLLACVLFIQAPAAYAASLDDLKKERSELEVQKKKLNKSLEQKANELKTNQNRQEKLISQLEQIGAKINSTNHNISVVELDIEIANQEIADLEKDIEALQEKIDQRDALLRERARAIQTGGTVSYIDVLLGANSFVDFIDRFSAVSTLMDADRQIMREQKEDQEKLEIQKAELIVKKENLEANKAELEKLKAELVQQKKEKNQLVDELEKEEARLHDQKEQLETHIHETIELSKETEAAIKKEQNRLLEIARKKALEKAAANKKQQGSVSAGSGNLPTVSAGTWTRPAAGRFTSGFGRRNIGPIGSKDHLGIDIANSIGTPVIAAADGVVSYVGTMNGYGNLVMVTHSLDGAQFTTVYAHLSGFTSSVGDVVSKGDQIAKMGNTGNSTGPHVHFEIHVGEWNGRRSNAVNPLRYVSL